MTPILPAKLDWRDSDTPVSIEYDDVYFSTVDGIDETQYVFLKHNGFPERFIAHPHTTLVVAETGFGTGLNLCLLWQAFRQFRQAHPQARCRRLHFVSMEKHPVTDADLRRAHKYWPQLQHQTRQLQQAYPAPIGGCHRMEFDQGEVVVDLWLGDVNEILPSMVTDDSGLFDAWFLDGFTPSKNPAMWQPELYTQMARLSRHQATYATFTAAGHVRRGLERVGFSVTKDHGYGVKREMISGQLLNAKPVAKTVSEVAIVGAGVAAAHLALSLVQRGIRVTLYSQGQASADGASGNRQGAIYPLMNLAEDGLSQLYQQGFLLSRQRLNRTVAAGHSIDHDWCGVVQLGQNDKDQAKLAKVATAGFPPELVHGIDRQQASHIADLPLDRGGLFFPFGGWVAPNQLIPALLAQAGQLGQLQCHYDHPLKSLTASDNGWQLDFHNGQQTHHDQVVIAMGHQSHQLAQTAPLPIQAVRGQISAPQTTPRLNQLKTVLCADGYLIPQLQGRLTSGASFVKRNSDSRWQQQDVAEIRQRMHASFGQCGWAQELMFDDSGRAAVRGSVRDHFPLAGPVPDWPQIIDRQSQLRQQPLPSQPGLHLLAGLGSRGLCSAALMAESVVSSLCAEPRPIDQALLARVVPGRFWQRRLNKGHPVPE
ncbi:bifunctional tRNA (5-methylaminomethyl-2-thiouridine)(34)-methyltransferase MnmD/FAD-dependent 5-carboxymethylaminomethyl-2-thiouridine(34) oxidoreductase MnmC [Ferrimonas sp. SCSIO 43195]|uniref:bifunctional tRNA (5-methylaminomethyl-2-thiouridine)(34)-methyltransferase MnmD/FAD-dependent 5-carboxymethylaminomethyl-2-thiouridine(34) oxidoreductase MnmC n=1 Tax=Ferrimonas sp. SCSIO 43195 TaxID=2822844 RepID=UPI0020750FA7|nr:bifunctional tRNA (5-methylaminomethyl-2-thiouridine)(34)-methyltransferase MnmD/FAD-dependent 5-carboxymethylaminomethyl-2-thiouridine(34) oxidoreductase MnmC [Ferrimonas sp. SCSIO 43195]USD36664.1 bifunctional tRNA (5-methylaminomethyl-2-thiouridine)(34)-methyltransferase MnmD/FAD-dependent 5-carboxymethylaminomethyl-2-thiouridine(34) oxidoreductase MnmC [Ferrimonas sp. SCSIO 43195]